MIITSDKISVEQFAELKSRKERQSVKKTLVEFLTSELKTLKKNDVKQIMFETDVHYYSVLKALRLFDAQLEYKIENVASRVNSIAIRVK